MVDLSTTYLGLSLKNPVIAAASPLSEKVENAQKLEEAGVSAIVMYSLFEEQIIRESLKLDSDLERGSNTYGEALNYLPQFGRYSVGPETYLEQLKKLKKAVSIPIIGSLNGFSTGGWIEYAKKIQDAGADALELNLYYLETNPATTSEQLEKTYLELVRNIRKSVQIPIATKLSPFFTAIPNFASHLVEAGVNGLVLFNRFYQPDFDLEALEVVPHLMLSTSEEMRLPLRWIAILYGHIAADFALTSGVHSAHDVIKAVMAGANVTAITSHFLKNGPESAAIILDELQNWLEQKDYDSISQMKGSMSQTAVGEPEAFTRANYLKVLSSY
jgi:dihydroorotate dehydrogenase (fumarate)